MPHPHSPRSPGPAGQAGPAGSRPAEPTRSTLLSRLRDTGDQASWREFEARYRELIVRFCRSRGAQVADAEDVAQSVLAAMVRTLPGFVYDRGRGRFRDYLFRCVRGAMSRQRGGGRPAAALPGDAEEPRGTDPAETRDWDREWMNHHYRIAIGSLAGSLDEQSIAVFEASMAGQTPQQIADARGMGLEAVYKARQRVRSKVEAIVAEQIADEERGDG